MDNSDGQGDDDGGTDDDAKDNGGKGSKLRSSPDPAFQGCADVAQGVLSDLAVATFAGTPVPALPGRS